MPLYEAVNALNMKDVLWSQNTKIHTHTEGVINPRRDRRDSALALWCDIICLLIGLTAPLGGQ